MWGLPDSAVLGTTKRLLKKSGKNKHRLSPTKNKERVLAQSWDCFDQDTRTFAELLEEAKRHAKEKEKAGK
jgi:hypothetical protein